MITHAITFVINNFKTSQVPVSTIDKLLIHDYEYAMPLKEDALYKHLCLQLFKW